MTYIVMNRLGLLAGTERMGLKAHGIKPNS